VPKRLPDWNDEKGVADLAGEIIADARLDAAERRVAYGDGPNFANSQTTADRFIAYADWVDRQNEISRFKDAEAAAVDAALLRGDWEPMANLVWSEHWKWAEPSTKSLVTRRVVPRRGRSKMTREERFANHPKHGAAAAAKFLWRHLQRRYPNISPRKVRARAYDIAAKRANHRSVTPKVLRDYFRKPRKGAHRLV